METPTISSSRYSTTTLAPGNVGVGAAGPILYGPDSAGMAMFGGDAAAHQANIGQQMFHVARRNEPFTHSALLDHFDRSQQQTETPMARRFAQVFIVDPDENVPLNNCLLYSGDPKMTDLTDQELFFEVDIKSILEQHNAKRVKLVNKKVRERTENLEPARIRDLKMVVVNIAAF